MNLNITYAGTAGVVSDFAGTSSWSKCVFSSVAILRVAIFSSFSSEVVGCSCLEAQARLESLLPKRDWRREFVRVTRFATEDQLHFRFSTFEFSSLSLFGAAFWILWRSSARSRKLTLCSSCSFTFIRNAAVSCDGGL